MKKVVNKGLRQLMGKDFDALCDSVFKALKPEYKKYWLNYAKKGHAGAPQQELQRMAADEFMAHIAEQMDFNGEEKTIWDTIVKFIKTWLKGKGFTPTEEHVRSLLRASYSGMVKGNISEQRTSSQESTTDAQRAAKIKELVGKFPTREQLEKAQGSLALSEFYHIAEEALSLHYRLPSFDYGHNGDFFPSTPDYIDHHNVSEQVEYFQRVKDMLEQELEKPTKEQLSTISKLIKGDARLEAAINGTELNKGSADYLISTIERLNRLGDGLFTIPQDYENAYSEVEKTASLNRGNISEQAGEQKNTANDKMFRISSEIEQEYPNWLDGTTSSNGKHSTQVEGTRKTYNRIGDWIEQNIGKDAAILDASSGLGYGTADLKARGFNIEDIEPYQSQERLQSNPATYSSYSDIDKQYDYIISNAVLNVIPNDWRVNVLHDMASKLKAGGTMFINTRKAGEEKTIKDKIELDTPQEVLVKRNGKIASYQKFFTPSELKGWVQEQLGDGYTVEIANEQNSNTKRLAAVVVKKKATTQNEHKAKAKKVYDIVLTKNFNDVNLALINEYINETIKLGDSISKRLPQEVERSLYGGEQANYVDALVGRISESTVEKARRTSEDGRRKIEETKKEILKSWAIASGNWHTNLSQFVASNEIIGEGKDSKVYEAKEQGFVIKASKGKPYEKRFRPDIDNIALFNYVFPNTRYDILGYGEIDGSFVRILRQPAVDFADNAQISKTERVEYMKKLGFLPINKSNTAFTNDNLISADLQKGNIVRSSSGHIRVIDADMKLHTKDVGGKYSYPPVETDTDTNSQTASATNIRFSISSDTLGSDIPKEEQTPKNTDISTVLYSLKVNHNTPYLLKKADGSFIDPETGERLGFDHRFMGTGEGAQVWGWGSYFSVRDIRGYAEFSRVILKDGGKFPRNLRWLSQVLWQEVANKHDQGKPLEQATQEAVEERIALYEKRERLGYNSDEDRDALAFLVANEDNITIPTERHHYEVEIPDDNGSNYIRRGELPQDLLRTVLSELPTEQRVQLAHFLLSMWYWNGTFTKETFDKHRYYHTRKTRGRPYPLPENETTVDAIFNAAVETHEQDNDRFDIYNLVRMAMPEFSEPATAAFLNKLGIVGVHYEGRRDGEGFVIFDENDAKIVNHTRFKLQDDASADHTRNAMQSASQQVRAAIEEAVPDLSAFRSAKSVSDEVRNLTATRNGEARLKSIAKKLAKQKGDADAIYAELTRLVDEAQIMTANAEVWNHLSRPMMSLNYLFGKMARHNTLTILISGKNGLATFGIGPTPYQRRIKPKYFGRALLYLQCRARRRRTRTSTIKKQAS